MESPRAETSTTGRVVRPRPAWAAAGWLRWVPGIQMVRHYESRYLQAEAVVWVDWEDRIVGGIPDRAQDGSAAGPLGTPRQSR
jgi:hypothetical protein